MNLTRGGGSAWYRLTNATSADRGDIAPPLPALLVERGDVARAVRAVGVTLLPRAERGDRRPPSAKRGEMALAVSDLDIMRAASVG